MVSPSAEHPFCSPRCKAIDLYRWLDEGYRIEETDFESVPEGEGISEAGERKG